MNNFKLSASQILPIAQGHGGCIASDRITVDGAPVGYCYREVPVNKMDSGWRFLAGDENDEYMQNSSLHRVYDVNTIANYDRSIIPILNSQVGTAFERVDGKLALIQDA